MNRRTGVVIEKPLILLTGATGYVGGRLLKALEAGGQRVRCLARRPDMLAPKIDPSTQVVEGDALDLLAGDRLRAPRGAGRRVVAGI